MTLDSVVHVHRTPRPLRWGPEALHTVGRLLVSCQDRPGIVSAVTGYLLQWGANIIESQQYTTDPVGGCFFQRVEFMLPELDRKQMDLEYGFTELGESFGMEWRFTRAAQTKRLGVLVSKADHALSGVTLAQADR